MFHVRVREVFAGHGLRQIALVASVAALLAAFSGIALVGANGDQLKACVNKYTGVVRMETTNHPLHCQSHEEMRVWDSEVGAVTAPQIVHDQIITHASTPFTEAAQCPAGTNLIGGGASIGNPDFALQGSMPDEQNNAWVATGVRRYGTVSDTTFDVYAICVLAAD